METLQHYRREGSYKLFAFVVMPDHIHLIIQTENLPKSMKDLKGGFTSRMRGRFWQPGFTDHLILNREQFESRREYIHQNPVRAGLCEKAEDYPSLIRVSRMSRGGGEGAVLSAGSKTRPFRYCLMP